MDSLLFGPELWEPALDKFSEASGLGVELFDINGNAALGSTHLSPLAALFRQYDFEPGLFADCARRCLQQTGSRPAVIVAEAHGLMVVGTSLALEGAIVGAAVAGYALAGFSAVATLQRWAKTCRIPFGQLWHIVRRQPPLPERRLILHGELLQVLGDALLRENHRTRQHEETTLELRAANAAKDEFIAVLSHELRTPLAAILGWANVLKLVDTESVRRAAEAIERNAVLQARMVDDLLDVNRIQRGAVTLSCGKIELRPLIDATIEASAQDRLKKALRLELIDAAQSVFVEGDSGRLQQVFRNIISNAVKFTPEGGRIVVTLSREPDEARVTVADTGAGISAAFLPFVFDLFRQQENGTRRQHEGLGIGLALVKRLVDLHHGTVSVTSEGPGRGTAVTIRLPLAAETAGIEPVAPAEAMAPLTMALQGLCVLVVEDSDDTRDTLRMLLQHLGAKVSVAHDGREALDLLKDFDADLVLCDLRMPRMDGFEFLRELHAATFTGHTPVVAMSALASKADHERTRHAGFEGHIDKPFDEATVIKAVNEALRQKQERSLPRH